MTEPFQGFEPQVGEIRAVRTFRIGPGGRLHPLFGDVPWETGDNTAACRLQTPWSDPHDRHRAPDPDCSCGFYAYADPRSAVDYAYSEHVLAVVACWGRTIAGTRGLRAEHARVEALWLSPTVPPELVREVTVANPGVWVYADRDEMLDRHPPTVLDCYEPVPDPPSPGRRRATRAAVVLAVLAGFAPSAWFGVTSNGALAAWTPALAVLVLVAAVGTRRAAGVRAQRRVLLLAALGVWLVAPLAGTAGTVLLRLPLAEVAVLGLWSRYQLRRRAATFPARIP